MIVAVYITPEPGFTQYIRIAQRLLNEWADKHPGNEFYFFIHKPHVTAFELFGSKKVQVSSLPPYSNNIISKWRRRTNLISQIRRLKADVFFSIGSYIMPTNTVIQYLFISSLIKERDQKKLRRVKNVFVTSKALKEILVNQHLAMPEKVYVIYGASLDEAELTSDEEKSAIKEEFTDGKEYFLYTGLIAPQENIITLLKAFSLFKKRQRSSMKLVLAGIRLWKIDEFEHLIRTYKYKDDLVIVENLNEKEQRKLLFGAYALINLGKETSNIFFALSAMQYAIPIISNRNTPLKEIENSPSLLFDPLDMADIADKLMMIYKDEALKGQMEARAKELTEKFSWKKSADTIWQCWLNQ